jgi:hypothetical protein
MRKAYKILGGKAEGKRTLGRPKRRWKDNITMALRKTGFRVWMVFIWLGIRTGDVLL